MRIVVFFSFLFIMAISSASIASERDDLFTKKAVQISLETARQFCIKDKINVVVCENILLLAIDYIQEKFVFNNNDKNLLPIYFTVSVDSCVEQNYNREQCVGVSGRVFSLTLAMFAAVIKKIETDPLYQEL